jgi:disulfide bond formation protein DsbB
MSFQIITTGFAVLALVADALVVLAIVGFVASRASVAGRARWGSFRESVSPFALQFAWIVAALATLGSLYLSQIAGLTPCEFCWFQRICMYPLSLLLGIAAFRGEVGIAKRYFMPIAIVGAGLAIYHYQLEHIAGEPTACSVQVPCNSAAFNIFGFISVPFLSLAAFALITTLLLLARGYREDDEQYLDDDVATADGIEPGDETVPAPA